MLTFVFNLTCKSHLGQAQRHQYPHRHPEQTVATSSQLTTMSWLLSCKVTMTTKIREQKYQELQSIIAQVLLYYL